ncbi:MAG: tetratricopeptide repeat protein [Candidatus Aminicenantes bacterium]|nr:tetratricopeptide repeat protein [Candidatus Aminicenantes bacterium]
MESQKTVRKHRRLKHKWLYAVVSMTVVPFLILVGIELGLRSAGVGYPTSYFIKNKKNNIYLSNQRYGWRFFPPQLARHPFLNSIPAEKPEGTYRIFVLGGSAAKGEPDYSFNFARILEQMLYHHYPNRKFEIINTAMVAINSHVVHEITKDSAKLKPDLFIVYLGNNEVVGPFGAGTIFQSFSPNLAMIRASLWVKSLKIGQLLDSLVQNLLSKEQKNRVWRGMEMFLENRVPLNDPRLEKVYTHFERNLDDIIDTGCDSGAKVIVCTVATNLKDNAPFASMHRQDLSEAQRVDWEGYYKAGTELEAEGRYAEAADRYLQAGQIDDHYADLHFRLARCYMQLNRYEEAQEYYIKARDRDALRFRADTQINRIIRESALHRENDGVYLVDAERSFEENQRASSDIPGEELFYEHVHMNFFGNYLLAESVFSQVRAILPEDFRSPTSGGILLLSQDRYASLLAFTMWDLNKILGRVLERITRPPFTNQIDHDMLKKKILERMTQLKNFLTPKVLDLVQQVYERALEKRPDDWILHNNFAEFHRERGEYDKSIAHWQIVLNTVPNFADVNNNLGALLVYEGKYNEAIDYFLKSLGINPYLVEAHINLGVVLKKTEKKDEAIKHFSEALRLSPDNETARRHLENYALIKNP